MARKLPFSCRGTAVGLRAASASAALRLCRYFSRGDGASSPHQAPIWIKAITRGMGPLPQSGPEIPRFHAVSKCLFLQTSWFLASPVMAHGMGGKESGLPDLVGASGLLIRPVVFSNPYARLAVHSNASSKKLVHFKGDLVPHDVIRCTAQLVCQCTMSNHEIRLGCFAIIVSLHLRIEAPRHFCGLRESPC
jgi:hypothetical protein